MSLAEDIRARVKAELSPEYLDVINESYRHSGPTTESHFRLVLVSPAFVSLNPVQRHRLVHRVLSAEIQRLHALALTLRAPEEWKAHSDFMSSPDCAGPPAE